MSSLYIKAENRGGRTVISDCKFTSPLKIAKPFYGDDRTEIMMMTASAGMLEGDIYDISINVSENASLKFTGQSYTKLFKSDKNGSAQKVGINVEKGGRLLYFPSPMIPFAESAYSAETEIHLDGSSCFAMCDIISCGRTAMNEKFLFKEYRSRTLVYVDGKPVFLDNVRLLPSEINLSGIGFFENYSHIGMVYAYGHNIPDLPKISEFEAAVTKASEGFCIRAAANSADTIYKLFSELLDQRKQLSAF